LPFWGGGNMARVDLGGLGIFAAAAAGAWLLFNAGEWQPMGGDITTPHDEGTPADTPAGVSEDLNESVTDAAETAWTGAYEFIPANDSGGSSSTSPIMQDAIDAGGGPTPTIPDDPVIDDTWGDPTPTPDEDPADAGGVDSDGTTALEETRDAISSGAFAEVAF